MERTRFYKVLKGYRNIPPANLDLLAEILVRLSQLVTDFPEIVELDINPLLISQWPALWRWMPGLSWNRAPCRPPAT